MRKMGGLARTIPVTYALMLVGTLALTGVGIPGTSFGFAGFFSKDSIIEAAYAVGGTAGGFAFWSLVIAAVFTSFYSWRLIHLTFHGTSRAAESVMHHAHESPRVMIWPLYVLGAGSVLAGVLFYDVFFGHAEHVEHFFAGSLVVGAEIIEAAHGVPHWVKWSATIAMLVGFGVAWQMYIRDTAMPGRLAAQHRLLYQFLLNKWYFDELYDLIFVRPAKWLGRALWRGFDDWLVDKTIVEGLGHRVMDVTARVVRLQSGYLYHYAFAMLIGIAALLTWAIAAGGLLG
jgi:NADH-quinone oxidoreductase subunit L